jgi:type IV secretory pathway ATPase VirB11/archaellum biosynthesis ATPase
MVCSNCKRLLLKTGVRYSHITQGNIRTCPHVGGFLYVKPVYNVNISQLNTQIILHVSSYINYFETQTLLPLISKQFNSIINTVPKSIKRTINMKKKILHATLFQLKRVTTVFPSFDIDLFLSYDNEYINKNSPDLITAKNLIAYKRIKKEIDHILFN